ncbi:TRAP transporter small permease subunit [Sulfurimonas autotrophica]|uniref:Tripartite ATP-independent periplasmic transporter DctQ component n=1 Tax=Sulfurimonas autotrophica (strain ATCC BAA-671 / DSM 16294 / JCM 11897 / OK10) TaxID=563040 RepID=E0URQ0_SULAO|nr:TRAP transporter small permease subunit [Sulfurimonas autotrophica]ADN08994.1 Tripartite ATP-independent periplasmic transporter DctQ component [Sulfurimonas autotrophica DSM 16294]
MLHVVDKFMKYVAYLTAVILALLVVLVVFDATSRYLFSHGSTALQELEWHFFDVVILLSIAFTLRYNAHVRVDIFYDRFSPKTQAFINIVSALFFVLPLSFLIIYIGIDFVEMSFVQHEASSDPGGLKYRWIVKALMPLGFIFLLLQALKELISDIKKWKSL